MNRRGRHLPRLLLLAIALGVAACAGSAPDGEPTGSSPQRIDPAEVERLRALGYVNVAPALDPGASVGVLVHDRERSAPGLNLLSHAKFCSAQLIDMGGTVLHTWSLEPCFRWGNAALADNGDLLVIQRHPHDNTPASAERTRLLTRLDWDGEVVWSKQMAVHHDVTQTPDGRILALGLDLRVNPEAHPEIPLRDNTILLLDASGELQEQVSLWTLLHSAPEIFEPETVNPREFEGGREIDAFHANSVEWVHHPELVGRHAIYGPETVLFCMRNQDTLAIADWKTKRLLWAWGRGELSGPHDATMLPNGNILAFDNGLGRAWSRVVEIDPIAREIVWEYRAPDPTSFYSETRGANQRLLSGHTLVTESDRGRVFEVTPEGDVVWEFLNPAMTDRREPSVIVRARRLEGIDYASLAARVRSGRGLPFRVD